MNNQLLWSICCPQIGTLKMFIRNYDSLFGRISLWSELKYDSFWLSSTFQSTFLWTADFSFTFANVLLMVDFSFSTVHIRTTLFIWLLKQIVDSILVPFRWVTAHRERCFTVGYAIDLVRLWDLCQSPSPSQCHKVFPTAKIAQVNSYFVFSSAEFLCLMEMKSVEPEKQNKTTELGIVIL